MRTTALLALFVSFGALSFADEPKACTAQQREVAAEWKFLSSHPVIKDPQKDVRPGDVIVFLLPPEEELVNDPVAVLMSHKAHASLVIRNKDGVLGRLESPAYLGNHFVPFSEALVSLPYVVIRPKLEGKLAEQFSSRAAFENAINRAGQTLEKLRYVYGSDMVLDVLDPKHRKTLQEKFKKQCLSATDVPGQYCSELPLTALTMIGLETTEAFPMSRLLPKIEALLKPYDEAKREVALDEISRAFVEDMTKENTHEIRTLEKELKAIEGDLAHANRITTPDNVIGFQNRPVKYSKLDSAAVQKLSNAKTDEAVKEALKGVVASLRAGQLALGKELLIKRAEKTMVEATRLRYVAALKKRLRGEALSKEQEALFAQKLVRPHDLLTAGGPDWKFEIVGYSTNGYECDAGQGRALPTPLPH